ncbi:MAG: hypothetical protein K9L22_04685 [Methylococcaceae bacterium]|nr:hypothetical protein [Methylococcaceae bacterium]
MIRIYTSKDVQKEVKSTVCKIQGGSVCLIFDETIQEKNWTDESEIMYWHF